ncbi:DUF3800 domain-containing protein [Bradyrhizobium yuanmingense]|uniref:DUF3800 domain-containing protein n=1 Tax=Bradyrhizobium yuanmingense TaxID=108015 RepID=UPI0035161E8D
MYVGYFDEVKADRDQGRANYLVAGLIIPMDQIGIIERQMTELAVELFGSRELVKDTEFHADSIYRAKDNFRARRMDERAAVLGRLAKVIGDNRYIAKVYAAIDSSKLFNPDQAAEIAFAHFVERVQMCVWEKPCVLIGDEGDTEAKNMVRDFAQFRAKGTPWAHGIEIKTVVDTVHFCKSHHSRLIQLADAYAWLTVHQWGLRRGVMAMLVDEAIKGVDLFPNRYKHWPK